MMLKSAVRLWGKESLEELDLTKSDGKYLISMLSISIATSIRGTESTLKHQSIYPQHYCVAGKIYIRRNKVVSWWLLGSILRVLFAFSALTFSLTFRLPFCLFHVLSHGQWHKKNDQRNQNKAWRFWRKINLSITEPGIV